MIEGFESISVAVLDLFLGWLVRLQEDLRLLIVAIITSVILVLIRKHTTNQDVLERAASDRKTLVRLIGQGRDEGDAPAVQRYRLTRSQVAARRLKYEVLPLAISIVPVAALALWCSARLAYHPPAAEEVIEVVARGPRSAVGEVMHLAPVDGLDCERPITIIAAGSAEDGSDRGGVATWSIRARACGEPYELVFHHGEETFSHELLIGQPIYSRDIVEQHDNGWTTEIRLRPVRLFGFVPSLGAHLPPWLVGYVLLILPVSRITRWFLRVY